jgi:hypothetical protein
MYQWESCGNLSPSVVLAPGHSMHEERDALIYDLSCQGRTLKHLDGVSVEGLPTQTLSVLGWRSTNRSEWVVNRQITMLQLTPALLAFSLSVMYHGLLHDSCTLFRQCLSQSNIRQRLSLKSTANVHKDSVMNMSENAIHKIRNRHERGIM